MAYTPIPKGTDPWDVQVNGAFTDQDNRITANTDAISAIQVVDGQQWNEITINRNNIAALRVNGAIPQDYGLLSWSHDPGASAGGSAIPNNTMIMTKIWINDGTVNNLCFSVDAVGTSPVANQNFLGLYNSSGTRIGQTADISGTLTSAGFKRIPTTAPIPVTAGFYNVAILCNAATPPNLIRGSNATSSATNINMDLTAANYRYSSGPTGTSLPASVDMSARTPRVQAYWFAVG